MSKAIDNPIFGKSQNTIFDRQEDLNMENDKQSGTNEQPSVCCELL